LGSDARQVVPRIDVHEPCVERTGVGAVHPKIQAGAHDELLLGTPSATSKYRSPRRLAMSSSWGAAFGDAAAREHDDLMRALDRPKVAR